MDNKLGIFVILVLIAALLILVSCDAQSRLPSVNDLLLPMATDGSGVCVACAQATLDTALTQEQSSADAQAMATAEVMRADAQATLNSVGATLGAAQADEQNKANILAAELAATADIIRADAQATLVAAGATQNAAQTQDAIRQTQAQFSLQVTADLATQNAQATTTQQNNNLIAATTQTAVADLIATQTQSAVATLQWSADQDRQRTEQGMSQLAILGLLCLPILVILGILGIWRWMKIRETQQRIDMQLTAPYVEDPIFSQDSSRRGPRASFAAPVVIDHEPRSTSQVDLTQFQAIGPAESTDPVQGWLEEVKDKLLTNEKDDHDHADR
jgi:hypothetical protein